MSLDNNVESMVGFMQQELDVQNIFQRDIYPAFLESHNLILEKRVKQKDDKLVECREEKRHQRLFIRAAGNAMFRLDYDGNIVHPWNPASQVLFGYTRREALGLKVGKDNGSLVIDKGPMDFKDLLSPSSVEDFLDFFVNIRDDMSNLGKTSVRQYDAMTSNGKKVPIEVFFTPIKINKQVYVNVEARNIEKQKYLLTHNLLTDALNRHGFYENLDNCMRHARRNEDYQIALLYLDLDKFKPVNDTHGHEAGDQVLEEAVSRIRSCIREVDYVGRHGGDEFVIGLVNPEKGDIVNVATRIKDALRRPYRVKISEGNYLDIKDIDVSIGIHYVNPDEDVETNIFKADTAMYHAKKTGDGIALYYPKMSIIKK